MVKKIDVYTLAFLIWAPLGGWLWYRLPPEWRATAALSWLLIGGLLVVLLRAHWKLNRRLERERATRERQREYFALAIHELNTPLAAVRGRLDMLVRENLADLSPAQRQRFAPLVQVTDRLTDLVGDLLDTSRLEAGRFTFSLRPTDIRPLLRECWQEITPLLPPGSPHHLLLPRSPLIGEVDPVRWRQIIRNLLTNAIKYGAGSSITLRARSRHNELEVMVQDQGPGLNARELSNLGRKFYRAPGRPDQPPGTGLGLFITRRLVRAHRGYLMFESAGAGAGLTALIYLPVSENPPQP